MNWKEFRKALKDPYIIELMILNGAIVLITVAVAVLLFTGAEI